MRSVGLYADTSLAVAVRAAVGLAVRVLVSLVLMRSLISLV
jgi:hypothetical protein